MNSSTEQKRAGQTKAGVKTTLTKDCPKEQTTRKQCQTLKTIQDSHQVSRRQATTTTTTTTAPTQLTKAEQQ